MSGEKLLMECQFLYTDILKCELQPSGIIVEYFYISEVTN